MALRNAVANANPESQVYLNPVYPQVNSVGALLLNYSSEFGATIEDNAPAAGLAKVLEAAAKGQLRALLVFDEDILSTYPDYKLVDKALSTADSVIFIGPFACPTSERSQVHLPLGTFAHREGLVVNLEWRVQKRSAANISPAPSVLEVTNGLCTQLDSEPVALDNEELHARLSGTLPGWPKDSLSFFEPKGRFVSFASVGEELRGGASIELPAEVKGNAEHPLVVIPKRFMYNDRQELRNSSVFERIAMPFYAFLNPTDMKVLNLNAGDTVALEGGHSSSVLTIKPGAWVRAGSVVINDYYLGAPANAIAGFEPVRVAVKRAARAVEAGA
jgi:formate dehydrogenase major subunit